MIRVGQGYDVHRFNDGDHIILGGVKIPYEKGLEAHSDGDVVLHALADAILGAAALGDIGKHFPPTDMRYKGIDSRRLLQHVVALLRDKGFTVGNIDATVICEAPKLSPHTTQMSINIAADCNVDVSHINVKATTTEKLGFTGRGEGIAAEAVCLLQSL